MGDWLRAGLPLADLRAGGLYAGAAGASNDHAEGFAACFVVTTPPPSRRSVSGRFTIGVGRRVCTMDSGSDTTRLTSLSHKDTGWSFRFNQIYARFCLLPSSLAFQRPLEPAWTLGPTALPSCV
jgi:hypothetical protein